MGCTKVDDPYFGRRKPSEIVKRINRKISLLESQKEPREINCGQCSGTLSATNFISNDRSNSSKQGMKKDDPKSRSNENLMNNAMLRQKQRAATAPGTLTTTSISNDKWPTKDEFVSLLFRMI